MTSDEQKDIEYLDNIARKQEGQKAAVDYEGGWWVDAGNIGEEEKIRIY